MRVITVVDMGHKDKGQRIKIFYRGGNKDA